MLPKDILLETLMRLSRSRLVRLLLNAALIIVIAGGVNWYDWDLIIRLMDLILWECESEKPFRNFCNFVVVSCSRHRVCENLNVSWFHSWAAFNFMQRSRRVRFVLWFAFCFDQFALTSTKRVADYVKLTWRMDLKNRKKGSGSFTKMPAWKSTWGLFYLESKN